MVDETAVVVEEVADPPAIPREDSVEAARDASEPQPEDFFAGEVDNTETKGIHLVKFAAKKWVTSDSRKSARKNVSKCSKIPTHLMSLTKHLS